MHEDYFQIHFKLLKTERSNMASKIAAKTEMHMYQLFSVFKLSTETKN